MNLTHVLFHYQLLEVMDRIEDELNLTYEELVPLEVKLALEDKVFGWSHLTSDILGHVVYTLGAYTLVYLFITHVIHRPERMPIFLFRLLRFLLSFWAGLSAFRMVRNRKKVWLRSAYGSKDYEQDAHRRRQSIRQSDRTTLLGRIRRRRELRKELKHQRKLRKAVERFEQKKSKTSKQNSQRFTPTTSVCLLSDTQHVAGPATHGSLILAKQNDKALTQARRRTTFHALPTQNTESIGHDQCLFIDGPIRNMPYAHGSFFGAAPFMLANPHWIDVLRLLMPDVYIEISLRVVQAPAPKLIHWAENNPVVAAYGTAHELENNGVVPNLEWDVFLDPHLVHRVDIVLEEQEKFLRSCAPDSFQELSGKRLRDKVLESAEALGLTASQQSILVYYEKEVRRRTEALVDNMLIAHGSLTQLLLEQTGCFKKYNFSRVKRTRRSLGGGMFARQWLAVFAEALKLGRCLNGESSITRKNSTKEAALYSQSNLKTSSSSSSSEDEDDDSTFRCQCLQCTRTMHEAEGAGDPFVLDRQESDTPCKHRQRTDALERRSASFAEGSPAQKSSAELSPLRDRTFSDNVVVSSSHCLSTSIAESISTIKFMTGCDAALGLVFDVKTRSSSKQVWGVIVDFLRDAGARVEGLASFVVDDIRDITNYTSKPVKEVFFFHSAGDVQQACHDGRLRQGDTVLFNAGSLLWDSRSGDSELLTFKTLCKCWEPFDANAVKSRYRLLPFARISRDDTSNEEEQYPQVNSTIQHYKERFGLSIGLYCQEFAIDEAAVNVIVKLVNDHAEVYDLGLSWGGVNGITVRGIQPGRFTLTDGFWNQRYAGASWDYTLQAQDAWERQVSP